jgi:epoxyqueuosine reductase QueG
MMLTDLKGKAEAFHAGGGENLVEHPEALSTVPISPAPLEIYDPPLFGVADAQDPLWARLKEAEVIGPGHWSPGEWLAGARSVVSYFLPYSAQVRRANRRKEGAATEWIYGQWEGAKFNAALVNFLVETLVAAGARAVAPMVNPCYKTVDLRCNWSERHAAFIAGLGTFGLSHALITPLGAAGRFGSVITDAHLEPTLRTYQAANSSCRTCGICIGRCPCQAITPSGKNHQRCLEYEDATLELYSPRYGCGKCMTGVPCEGRIPRTRPEFDPKP